MSASWGPNPPRPELVWIGIDIEAVTELAWNFSPIPWSAPPAFGRVGDTRSDNVPEGPSLAVAATGPKVEGPAGGRADASSAGGAPSGGRGAPTFGITAPSRECAQSQSPRSRARDAMIGAFRMAMEPTMKL